MLTGKLVINSSFQLHTLMYLHYWIHHHSGRLVNAWLFGNASGHMDSVIIINED